MTTSYTVTGVKVRFAPGFILALTKEQADIRTDALKKTKRKNQYEVLQTVEFKYGEEIGVVKGDIPKAWIDRLEQTSAKEHPEPSEFTMVHKGFGKWDVLDPDGKPINTEPLKKEDAKALLDAQDGSEDPDGGDDNDEDENGDADDDTDTDASNGDNTDSDPNTPDKNKGNPDTKKSGEQK